MAKRGYITGSRAEVLRDMALYAIRDQEALIDALTPAVGEPDEATAIAIQDARNSIADFERIKLTFRGAESETL